MRRWLVLVLFLGGTAFLVARIVTAYASYVLWVPPDIPHDLPTEPPTSPTSVDPMQAVEQILASGIFPTAPVAPRADAAGPAVRDPEAAARLRLMGTVVSDQWRSLAVFQDLSNGKQELLRLHDRLAGLGEIIDIRRNGVRVQTDAEVLFFELGAPVPKPVARVRPPPLRGAAQAAAPTHRVLDRREIAQRTADLPALLSQAKAVPHYSSGDLDGWRLDAVQAGGVFHRLGLEAGDIVQRVNGAEIRDPGMILTLLRQLKEEHRVTVDLLRRAAPMTFTYELR